MSDSAEVSETSGGCPSLETFCIGQEFQVNERPIEMCDSAVALRAEDEGFEPSRLSSTRVRDARTRPLCESSVGIIRRLSQIYKVRSFVRISLSLVLIFLINPTNRFLPLE